MVLDLILIIAFFVLCFLGYKKGLMRSVIGMVTTTISVIIAIALSKPIASLFDKIFKLSKLFGRLFIKSIEKLGQTSFLTDKATGPATSDQIKSINGSGTVGTVLEKIVRSIIEKGGGRITEYSSPAAYAARNLGFFALMITFAIVIFIGIRLLLRLMNRIIERWKENCATNKIDQSLGFLFGAGRFFVNVFFIFAIIFAISSAPLLDKLVTWLFNDSTIAKWLYEIVGKLVLFILKTFNIAALTINV